jgi:hypothetical protein
LCNAATSLTYVFYITLGRFPIRFAQLLQRAVQLGAHRACGQERISPPLAWCSLQDREHHNLSLLGVSSSSACSTSERTACSSERSTLLCLQVYKAFNIKVIFVLYVLFDAPLATNVENFENTP